MNDTTTNRLLANVLRHRAMITTDCDGVIRCVSPAAEELLGYSGAELVDRSLHVLHDPDELAARSRDGPSRSTP
jgi:PAS domain S-box-containing protein